MMQIDQRKHQCSFGKSPIIQAWYRELESLHVDTIVLDPRADFREVRLMRFLPGWRLDFRSCEAEIYVRQITGCVRQGLC